VRGGGGCCWVVCSPKAALRSNAHRDSKDVRAAEARSVAKLCRIIKRGQWAHEFENLNIRLRSKLVTKVLRTLDDPEPPPPGLLSRLPSPIFSSTKLYLCFDSVEILCPQEMHCQGLQATTSMFNILLLGFSRANETEKMVEAFKRMVQYGEENAFAFKCVIRSLVRNALSVYKDMLDFGHVPDNFTYIGLIEGLCKAGYVDEGFTVFLEMEDRGLTPPPMRL
jgi:pentatricopeptide repeat protein